MTRAQEVGQRIAQARRELAARERRDVQRTDLATAAGVDPSTITAWEQGKKSPREDALARLAAYLGVTPAFLRYGVGEGGMVAPDPLQDRKLTPDEIRAAQELVDAQPKRKPEAKRRRGTGGA
jgi:transcriptional regulator with XRE-family HTH domain